MFFVKRVFIVLADIDVPAHFALDHLLRDDFSAHVLFEVLKRNALGLGGLFQVFHAVKLHLLAQFVESLDDLGYRR